MRAIGPTCVVLALAACGGETAWLPAGATVPPPDAATLARIDANDGVERDVLLVTGFAEGDPVRYWDLGAVPSDDTMPMYFLCRRETGSACAPVDHPPVAELLPGDVGHSHFGRVHEVEVTDAWDGERLPSRQAIDDAVRDGLVRAPVRTDRSAHCPIVHPDVRLDLGEGSEAAPAPIYVGGIEAACIPFHETHGLRALSDTTEGLVLVRNVYALFRDGEDAPISEIVRDEDLTGDGDRRDTNNVLGVAFSSLTYTPLWRVVRVVVPAGYSSIDTSMDDATATYTAATDMFTIDPTTYEIEPIADRVVTHEVTTDLVDCPIQSAPGSL